MAWVVLTGGEELGRYPTQDEALQAASYLADRYPGRSFDIGRIDDIGEMRRILQAARKPGPPEPVRAGEEI